MWQAFVITTTLGGIFITGLTYAFQHYEPHSERRKRIYREKELARKALLQEQSEITQNKIK